MIPICMQGIIRMIMNAIVARNFGCNKLLVGENNRGLSVYYLDNEVHSIFDSLTGMNIEVEILPEYVYCDVLKRLYQSILVRMDIITILTIMQNFLSSFLD